MSWMLVTGKIYQCTNCGNHIQVEYENGAVMTQVSDEVCFQQSEMLDEFEQPNANPDTDGYYLQEKVTCEECYIKSGFNESDGGRLMALFDEVDKAANLIVGQVLAKFGNMTQEDMKDIFAIYANRAASEKMTKEDLKDFYAKDAYKDLDSTITLPSRKQEILNVVLQRLHKWGDCFYRYLPKRIAAELNELSKPRPDAKLKEFALQLKPDHLTVFIPKPIWEAENTNPYIQYEHTVRVPLSSTPKQFVYFEGNANLDEIKNNYISPLTESALYNIIKEYKHELVETTIESAHKHFIDGVPWPSLPFCLAS
jgi:hypothetical protein